MQTASQPQWVRKTYNRTCAFLLFVDGLALLGSLFQLVKAHPAFVDGVIDAIFIANAGMFFLMVWNAYRAAYRLLPAQSGETPLAARHSLPDALSQLALAGAGCTMMGLALGLILGRHLPH
jgi:uncharacterized membrane-anchored protein